MASSWVWNHFTDSGNRDKAQCKHCNKLLTCAGHSTSALARHLESQHQIFKLNPGRSSSLERHFQAVSSEQQLNRLHNKILRLIVEDMSPFQWTESKAFHDLWAEFAGSTPPPSAKVVKRLLEERYNDVLVKVKERVLAAAGYISLAADSWISSAAESHFAILATYITAQWTFESVLLDWKTTADHRSGVLSQIVEEAVHSFGLQMSDVAALTTDGASNMSAMCTNLNTSQLICAAHALHLAVCKGLEGYKELINKVSGIGTLFKSSPKLWARFKDFTESLPKKQDGKPWIAKKFKTDMKTRWSATYAMLCRANELKEPLSMFVVDGANPASGEPRQRMTLSAEEWKTIGLLQSALAPFATMTNLISGSTYCTMSAQYPFLLLLRNVLRQGCSSNQPVIQKFSSAALPDLESRIPRDARYLLACLLDPRWKEVEFLTADEKQTALNHLYERYLAVGVQIANEARDAATAAPTPTDEPIKKRKSDFAKFADETAAFLRQVYGASAELIPCGEDVNAAVARVRLLDNLVSNMAASPVVEAHEGLEEQQETTMLSAHQQQSGQQSGQRTATPPMTAVEFGLGSPLILGTTDTLELEQYLRVSKIKSDADPLDWWRKNEDLFPTIARIARQILALQASSANVERVFSHAETIINDARTRLSANNVHKLMFLHENWPVVQPL